MAVSVSVARFKKAFPEFDATDYALVEEKIRSASLRISESVFGDSAVDAIMWRAAHLLSRSPSGEHARLKPGEKTMYELEYDALVREKTIGHKRTV